MKPTIILLLTFTIFLTGCARLPGEDQSIIVVSTFRGDLSFGGLYAIHPDGSSATDILIGLGNEPRWSKDGKWVVSSKKNFLKMTESQIILMKANGTNPILLTDEHKRSSSPAWAPDGRTIAYERGGKLYTLDVGCFIDGKNSKECPVTPRLLTEGYAPDWDPTGTKIIYNTYQSPSSERLIQVINADGTGTPETVTTPGLKYCREPKWSPDGDEIVIYCGGGKMYRIQKDGTLINSYLDLGISGGNPQWTPDGERILFISSMSDDLAKPVNMEGNVVSTALYSMKPNGTDVVRLTSRSDENILWFSWKTRSATEGATSW